ncbi:MAG: hypothetical protein H5U15_02180 [Roseovarius sp.]|jgi:hypothetical protein|nr:hypothetical protein [Roseovarius sp.]
MTLGRNLVGALFAALLCALPAVAPAAESAPLPKPPVGLMWNRSGLPAVFPLVVKTAPGQDYVLTLIDIETDEAVLAAYIEGGAFFRVLVPPGTFRLRFATGLIWRGEEELFGPGDSTEVFELDPPLTFETRGLGTKAGHIIDLREHAPGRLAEGGRIEDFEHKDQFICQWFRSEFAMPHPLPSGPGERRESFPDLVTRIDIRSRVCD